MRWQISGFPACPLGVYTRETIVQILLTYDVYTSVGTTPTSPREQSKFVNFVSQKTMTVSGVSFY